MELFYEPMEAKTLKRRISLGIGVLDTYDKVFIMLHGYDSSFVEARSCLPLHEYAERYHMIIVMPELGNRFYLDQTVGEDARSDTGLFLAEELPEFLCKRFRMKENLSVILGGYSMGGFGAILHGLKHPISFDAILSVSGAFLASEFARGSRFVVASPEKVREALDLFEIEEGKYPGDVLYDDKDRNPLALIRSMRDQEISLLPPIVVTCADRDLWYGSTVEMKEAMEKRGIKHSFYEIADGNHDYLEFDQSFRYAFKIIFGY